MILDFHLHSDTSFDSKLTIKEIYEAAQHQGLKYICMTNHHESIENQSGNYKQSLTSEKLEQYRKDMADIKQKDTKLFFGIEIGYSENDEEATKKFIAENDFDFVIGSVHYVKGIQLGNPRSAEKITKEDYNSMMEEYFRLLKKAINTKLFDVIGHIDLYKRVMPNIEFNHWKKQWKEVADLLVLTGTGFEINTSYYKIKPDEFYPEAEIIKLLVNKGVKIITIGTDTHRIEQIGKNIDLAENTLRALGVKQIYRFEKRKAIPLIL